MIGGKQGGVREGKWETGYGAKEKRAKTSEYCRFSSAFLGPGLVSWLAGWLAGWAGLSWGTLNWNWTS